MTDRLALSVDEVAAMLGVGRDCIYRAINKGEIPSLKVGGRRIVPRRWIEDTLNESAAAISDALALPSPPGADASEFGTAGTTAEPVLARAHVDDRVNPLAGGTPAFQSHTG